jgi:putative ABC transport system substrate-binding protein
LVGRNVDVIVASGPQAAQAAKEATRTIPIVMMAVADPVATGLVASLARPGGNVTGFTDSFPELGGKRLELLREVVPQATSVAVLWNPANPATAPELKAIQLTARARGITLESLEVRTADDFVRAFSVMSKRRPATLLTIVDTLTHPYREIIADFALKHRLPTIASREFAEAGGLMSYGPILPDMHGRAAIYVDRILKGASPADLPIEQPTKFDLVINLKTAKALGLTIPPSLLLRADQVIE